MTENFGVMDVSYIKKYVSPDATNKIHYHDWYEFILMDKGYMIYTAGGEVTKVTDKSIIYNPDHYLYNPFVQKSELYERYKIRLRSDFAENIIRDTTELNKMLEKPYIKQLSDSDFAELHSVFQRLYEAEEYGFSEYMAMAMLVIRAYEVKGIKVTANYSYITGVLDYIRNNYNKHLTAEGIAEKFYVSRSKLIYDFKSYCRMNMLEYITMTRLEEAKKLLLKGYSVAAVAECCGFSSSSYFIRVFSRIMGMTPLKFQINKR